jgi:hypothetical protein
MRYEIFEEGAKNALLVQAARWPTIGERKDLIGTLSNPRRKTFEKFLEMTMSSEVLRTANIYEIYMTNWMNESVVLIEKNYHNYRIRIRDHNSLKGLNAPDVLLIAIEMADGGPGSKYPRKKEDAIELLKRYINHSVFSESDESSGESVLKVSAHSSFLAYASRLDIPVPVFIYMWTDGDVMLLAIKEDRKIVIRTK